MSDMKNGCQRLFAAAARGDMPAIERELASGWPSAVAVPDEQVQVLCALTPLFYFETSPRLDKMDLLRRFLALYPKDTALRTLLRCAVLNDDPALVAALVHVGVDPYLCAEGESMNAIERAFYRLRQVRSASLPDMLGALFGDAPLTGLEQMNSLDGSGQHTFGMVHPLEWAALEGLQPVVEHLSARLPPDAPVWQSMGDKATHLLAPVDPSQAFTSADGCKRACGLIGAGAMLRDGRAGWLRLGALRSPSLPSGLAVWLLSVGTWTLGEPGAVAALDALISNGAVEVDQVEGGLTLLLRAVGGGHLLAATRLLALGADPFAVAQDTGNDAFDLLPDSAPGRDFAPLLHAARAHAAVGRVLPRLAGAPKSRTRPSS